VSNTRFMPERFDSLEIVLAHLEVMRSTLLGMKRVRQYIDGGLATEMLDSLIQEAESQISATQRRVVN
jgi:Tfp pilus assembly protein PilX